MVSQEEQWGMMKGSEDRRRDGGGVEERMRMSWTGEERKRRMERRVDK